MTSENRELLFQRWLQEHAGLIMKVVRAFTVTSDNRDDLFQEVLTQLWATLPNFRGDAKETTWIYRVSFNTAMAWQRGERRRERHHAKLWQVLASLQGSRANQEISHPNLIERLYDEIRELSKIDATLALMHLDGLSYREMAQVLGISENLVGVKLTRLRKLLAERLGRFDEYD